MNKKILLGMTILFLCFISGCKKDGPIDTPDNKSPLKLTISDTLLSWNDIKSEYGYILKQTIITTEETSQNLSVSSTSYSIKNIVEELKTKYLTFDLVYSVRAISVESSNEVTYHYDSTNAPISPDNLKINGTTLSFDKVPFVSSYQIVINFNNSPIGLENIITNSFDFSSYLTEEGNYEFLITARKGDTFKEDSKPSVITYDYVKEEENTTLLSLVLKDLSSFVGLDTSTKDKYADGSLKFAVKGAYFTTPSFTTRSSFSCTATIIGKGAGGTSTITFYGLDSNNNVVETVVKEVAIKNSAFELTADFNSINIQKIKIEYTVKATGNFGLIDLVVKTDSAIDKILKIEPKNFTTSYKVLEEFDESGELYITYKSGKTETKKISELGSLVTIENFMTYTFGTYSALLYYQGISCSFDYQVFYNYNAFYNLVDNLTITMLKISNDKFISVYTVWNGSDSIVLLVDQNDVFTNDEKNVLLEELSKIHKEIDYVYSLNNASSFDKSFEGIKMNLAPTISFEKTDLGMLVNAFGFTFLDTASTKVIKNSYDFIILNDMNNFSNINNDTQNYVLSVEPMTTSFINFGKDVYSFNKNYSAFSPDFADDFSITLSTTSITFDSNTPTEISSTSVWSNSELTLGLHHETGAYYVYRANYYGDVLSMGKETLLTHLHDLMIKTHTNIVKYEVARETAIITDADPLKPGNIILLYSGISTNGLWDNGITWNREHVWPKSLSGGLYPSVGNSDDGAGADLHQLKPASSSANSARGNKPYGDVTNEQTFRPFDNEIGDVARIIFYMSVHYDMDMIKLGVVSDVEILKRWNKLDSVDAFERNRNIKIKEVQGNYNPFIDNPWFADILW